MRIRTYWRLEAKIPANPDGFEPAVWAPLTDEEDIADEAQARALLARAQAEPGAQEIRLVRIEEYLEPDA